MLYQAYIQTVHLNFLVCSPMNEIKVTEFRANLPKYLARVRSGEVFAITSRGRVVARLTPAEDVSLSAERELAALRGKCRIGDVTSPLDVEWKAEW